MDLDGSFLWCHIFNVLHFFAKYMAGCFLAVAKLGMIR